MLIYSHINSKLFLRRAPPIALLLVGSTQNFAALTLLNQSLPGLPGYSGIEKALVLGNGEPVSHAGNVICNDTGFAALGFVR